MHSYRLKAVALMCLVCQLSRLLHHADKSFFQRGSGRWAIGKWDDMSVNKFVSLRVKRSTRDAQLLLLISQQSFSLLL
jgi:hypothetical protein